MKQITPPLPHALYPPEKAVMKSGMAGSLAAEESRKRSHGVEQLLKSSAFSLEHTELAIQQFTDMDGFCSKSILETLGI